MTLITISQLRELSAAQVSEYAMNLANTPEISWNSSALFSALMQVRSIDDDGLWLAPTRFEDFLILYMMQVNSNDGDIDWSFTGAPVLDGGYTLFRWTSNTGTRRTVLLSPEMSSVLYHVLDYFDDEGELPDDYTLIVPQEVYPNLPEDVKAFLRSHELASNDFEDVLPENSATIEMREDSSRFSGAAWYNAIQEKIITLAGVGGIGSYVGFLLARMHPKSMFIYDDDVVESANMSGQLYSRDDIGMAKVDALVNMVGRYANYESVFAVRGRFTTESEPSDIMICGFDNMEARRLFFEKWLTHVESKPMEEQAHCIFIDGRLAAEELQVFCITGNNRWAINEYRNRYLFSDAEADETVCSYKQTTYMANLIGSLMTNLFVNFVANEVAGWEDRDLPFFTSYDGLTMFFKTQNG